MTPAANERRLAGKWIVWWKHESRPAVDMAGNVTGWNFAKVWRHSQVTKRTKDILHTSRHERVITDNAFVVDGEISGWPAWDGLGYQPLTDSEFSKLTRCQP